MNIRYQSGLSLVEILVTLSIVALLASVAAPNLQSLMEKNKAHALNDEFANSLYRTRSESAKRGFHVTLCASNAAQTECLCTLSTDKESCASTAADFSQGWIIFTDYDGNGHFDPTLVFDTTGDGVNNASEEILFVSTVDADDSYRVISTATGNVDQITYRSDGLLDNTMNRTYLVAKKGSTTQLSKVSISRTGRVRSCAGEATSCD